MMLPITLTVAGIAALINIWLMVRIGQVRRAEGISVGDGGSENLTRRMRAQANFIESAPFVLILIGGIEFAIGSETWLRVVGSLYLLGRVAHGVGMDGGRFAKGRMIGTIVTMLVLLGLGITAVVLPYVYVGPADMMPGAIQTG